MLFGEDKDWKELMSDDAQVELADLIEKAKKHRCAYSQADDVKVAQVWAALTEISKDIKCIDCRLTKVEEILKKHLRLSKDEEAEASYKVLRAQMTPLDIAPNVDAWRAIRRIVARVNPKVQDADLDQILVNNAVRNLEESGFLAEMKKTLPH